MQKSFGCLWNNADSIEDGNLTVEQGNILAKMEATIYAKEQRSLGHKVSTTKMTGQLRQYWRFGIPCGLTCPVWLVNIF